VFLYNKDGKISDLRIFWFSLGSTIKNLIEKTGIEAL
jgi:hypothetical protein